ncbi:MAG: hypothetical protein ABJA83_15995 [Burkholderiaceae bacterium]
MTCSESMEALLAADIRAAELRFDVGDVTGDKALEIEAHVAGCDRCTRAVEIFRAAQAGLSDLLVLASAPHHVPESVAERAYIRSRRARIVRWAMPVVIILLVAGTALLASSLPSSLKRLLAPPPTVETQTFSLSCLSGEQAASLLRPYLPTPQNPMWQAESFDVRPADAGIRAVTVRAPGITLALVPRLLQRFEQDPNASCRVQPGRK